MPLLGIGTRWRGCHCWGAIAGDRAGGVGVHVGGLDVAALLAAIAGRHYWAAIAGDRGVGVQVGGDVVPLRG